MLYSCLTVLLIIASPAEGPSAVAPSVEPAASCKTCHADVSLARAGGEDVHADLECDECHPGRVFNPHAPSDADEDVLESAKAYTNMAEHSPVAFTTCVDCHDEVFEQWRTSAHGEAAIANSEQTGPSCAACHGSIHAVREGAHKDKLAMAERCVACHAFADEGRVPTNAHVVDSYRDTIHGKMLRLGNERAAGCADCHTGHQVYGSADARSSVHEDNRPQTCSACHPDAGVSFTGAISHEPHHIDTDFWGWVTALAFSFLTVTVIFLLFVHITLDFFRATQKAMVAKKDGHGHGVQDGPIPADAELPRFDIHARIQHWGMMTSFIMLVVTGWPLKAAAVGTSSALAMLFGGQEVLALVHRISGGLLLVVSVYHLAYLVARVRKGNLSLEMIPMPKDIMDLFENLAYMLGMREQRPKYGRWTYYEKFDYWAVFWGMVIMGGSGLILWFPVIFAKILPGKLISLSMIAHSDEALLAALAIFLWHFYNVHLRPSVFPMSWVWLSGRISAEAYWDEHRAQYEEEFGKVGPAAPVNQPTWHSQSRWSVIALAIVMVAGVVVVLGDVSGVRDRIRAMSAGEEIQIAATNDSTAGGATAVVAMSAFTEGFDAFSRCFACHNKRRYESGAAGFPHVMHFEENDVEPNCTECHQAVWHRSMTINSEPCMECHDDPEEIGLRPAAQEGGDPGEDAEAPSEQAPTDGQGDVEKD